MLCSSIPKRIGSKKINERVRKYLYNCILQHPKVVQYPIANDCLKESIDDHSETKLVTKLLLQVSVSKLHNSIASPPKEGGRRMQEKQKIISSLVILHYNQFYHPKSRICLHGTRSCLVVSAAYLRKVSIFYYYNGMIFI